MRKYLCLSATFLDPSPVFNGKADGGRPEWPPSPLRMFQAMVSAVGNQSRDIALNGRTKNAFEWLQEQDAPEIVAPHHRMGLPARVAVPNNDLNVVAAAWAKCQVPKKQPNELKTMKTVCPMRILRGDSQFAKVRYLFRLPDGGCSHPDDISSAARSVTHLGWGVDMVAGDASIVAGDEVAGFIGERWRPASDANATSLRVPMSGTLAALNLRHEAFLRRLGNDDSFKPVPLLTEFQVIGYRRETDPVPRPFAAFTILQPDASGFRPFDSIRRTRDVAGMIRHCVADVAQRQGWSNEQINVFVHGKSPDGGQPAKGETSPDRFLYLPLPTINGKLKRVETVRRFLIVAPAHCTNEVAWVKRALSGEDLTNDQGEVVALATILPGSDWVLNQYVGESATWSTVTPVILPRHDGYDPSEAGKWLSLAFEQSGYSRELMGLATLDWRKVGFRPGVDLARRYVPPDNLANKPRYHVRVTFPFPIKGPVAVGAGRFRGFGLFAAES